MVVADVFVAECVEAMRHLPDSSIDSIVCDPPYGLGFMGKAWDALPPGPEWAAECLRVLKPGGHLVAFGGTRTYHRLVVALEDAGFEIRDTISWCYWNGFPKSLDVAKAIDKARPEDPRVRVVCRWLRARIDEHPTHTVRTIADAFGYHSRMVDHWAARDTDSQPTTPTVEQWACLRDLLGLPDELDGVVASLNGAKGTPGPAWFEREVVAVREQRAMTGHVYGETAGVVVESLPATEDAARWVGFGTAVKPAVEPAVLARKPIVGTVAANVLEYGTGALNIDGCRFAPGAKEWPGPGGKPWSPPDAGRFPANLVHVPKASRKERERGCENLPPRSGAEAVDRTEGSAGMANPRAGAGRTAKEVRNYHPTVKPVGLMRWLARLVTPPGGLVLDPFAGSGSAGVAAVLEGFGYVGFEIDPGYAAIASARIAHAIENPDVWADTAPGTEASCDR